jgi:hypothetical protein
MASFVRSEVTKVLTANREAVAELRDLGWANTDSFLDSYTVKINGWCRGESKSIRINGDQLFRILDILAEKDN